MWEAGRGGGGEVGRGGGEEVGRGKRVGEGEVVRVMCIVVGLGGLRVVGEGVDSKDGGVGERVGG